MFVHVVGVLFFIQKLSYGDAPTKAVVLYSDILRLFPGEITYVHLINGFMELLLCLEFC